MSTSTVHENSCLGKPFFIVVRANGSLGICYRLRVACGCIPVYSANSFHEACRVIQASAIKSRSNASLSEVWSLGARLAAVHNRLT